MKVLIIWDAGHKMHTAGKRTPPFKDGKQIREYEFNRPTLNKCMAMAKSYGFEVFDTSPEEKEPGLNARVKRANDASRIFLEKNPDGVVLFVSIHYNAHKSEWDASTANGIEVFHNPGSVKGKPLAEAVLKELVKGTPMADRGVKSVGFYVLKYTTMPAILCECGFMDHKEDAVLMKDPNYQKECAREIINGIRKNLGLYEKEEETPIMGKTEVTAEQLCKYLLSMNAEPKIEIDPLEWCKLWIKEAAVEGVNAGPAFCQMCHETGYLKYGGQVLPEQNNYGGIGATNNSPVGKGAWFDTEQLGVRASIQHLKAYGSKEPLKQKCVDPRFSLVTRGSAPNFEDLGGRWAWPGYSKSKYASLEAAKAAKDTYGHYIIKKYEDLKKIKVDVANQNTSSNEIVKKIESLLSEAIELIGSLKTD